MSKRTVSVLAVLGATLALAASFTLGRLTAPSGDTVPDLHVQPSADGADDDYVPGSGDGGGGPAVVEGTGDVRDGELVCFPADNVWNTPIDHLPVHAESDLWVANIGADTGLHPDFGSDVWEGELIGIPWTYVDAQTPRVEVEFYYPEESDPGPYPMPYDPPIEGGPNATGDRHILMVDRDAGLLYELYDAWPRDDGTWEAGAGAIWDLDDNELRPEWWTSADAAGLPMLPGLVDYDEVLSGRIDHALRFTIEETRQEYVWPARHYASELTGAQYPPMGARFRLKADVDISGFSPQVRVILQALKTYGMFIADNGADWFLSGTEDPRWDDDVLHEMKDAIRGADFEAVDSSGMMIDPDSGAARQP